MARFEVLILGNSSALSAYGRHPSGQVVNIHEQYLLIDCGEGTQDRLSQYQIKAHRIDHIFISHLHGDHYFGLPGLITSFNLTGRKNPLFIYSPKGLKELIQMILDLAGSSLNYEITWIEINTSISILLLDDPIKQVHAFPLHHRIETYGFLVNEKPGHRIFRSELFLDRMPSFETIRKLKEGNDVLLENGQKLSVENCTHPPKNQRRYAYCSDTTFAPDIIPLIFESDMIYHEATYSESHYEKAKENFHSTAGQAAEIASKAGVKKLILGHFSSRYKVLDILLEEAKSVFPETELTIEGNWYQV